MKKNKASSFLFNTLIILISGFFIKLLGLINRIFITRTLGPENINLYIMSFPTIMLFISISGMSLYVSISKLVAESVKTKQYSPKIILKKAFLLSISVSVITSIIFLILLKPLTHNLLKNDDLYFPLLSTLLLIPLVGISDGLKGYFNGLKMMKFSATANMIEQLARIFFSITILLITHPYGPKVATFSCLLAMSIGEAASIIYLLIRIKKIGIIHYDNTTGELKAVVDIAVPTTFSRLIGNFTFFLEPIIYVWILSKLCYPHESIEKSYTIVNAYTISLLTIGSFVSIALSTTVVPGISENYVIKCFDKVNYYIKKTLICALIPGIFITIILFYFPSDIMKLIYGTTLGTSDIKLFVFFFLPYYLQAPLVAIYQAMGKSKDLFILSTIFDCLRLLLIVLLSMVPFISYSSLMIATTITLDLSFIIIFFKVIKLSKLKIDFNQSFSLVLISIFIFSLTALLKMINFPFIITIIIVGIIYLLCCHLFKLINFKAFFDKNNYK